jgi:tetratricopeptide (TPR) repeat protein
MPNALAHIELAMEGIMSGSTTCQYRFGRFCLDPEKLLLTKDGSAVALPPKALETLLILIRHRQAVLEKDEGLRKAIECFKIAIGEDPGYAAAYATLADCYHMRAINHFMTFPEAYPLEKAAATRALELDETLPQAHMAMSGVISNYEYDVEGARRELLRAIELDPNYATAHQRYAWMLLHQGKLDQALPEMKRAVDLDPLSIVNNLALVQFLYFDGQYDISIQRCRKVLELDPGSSMALDFLGLADLQKGLFEKALQELEQADRDDPESIETLGTLGNAYGMAGRKAAARRCIEKLERMSRHEDDALYGVAMAYAGTGDRDTSLAWFERAVQSEGSPLYFPRFDPRLSSIRADPRFANIIRVMDRPMRTREAARRNEQHPAPGSSSQSRRRG